MFNENEILEALYPKSLREEAMNFVNCVLENSKECGYPTDMKIDKSLGNKFLPSGTTLKIADFLKQFDCIDDFQQEMIEVNLDLWSMQLKGIHYKNLEDMYGIFVSDLTRYINKGLGYDPKPNKETAKPSSRKEPTEINFEPTFDCIFHDIKIDSSSLIAEIHGNIVMPTDSKTANAIAGLLVMIQKQIQGRPFLHRQGFATAAFNAAKPAKKRNKKAKPANTAKFAADTLSSMRKLLSEFDSTCEINDLTLSPYS